jgi:hypothetical protein
MHSWKGPFEGNPVYAARKRVVEEKSGFFPGKKAPKSSRAVQPVYLLARRGPALVSASLPGPNYLRGSPACRGVF